MNIQVLALPELIPVILTLISVFILYLILNKFLYTPVTEFIDKRESKIRGEIEESKLLKEEAIELKNNYEESISKLQEEGQEIIEGSRQRGNEIREDIINEAKEEAQEIVERGKQDIVRDQERAYKDMSKYTGEMAVLIASKIMEENITIDNQKDLIDKFIDEVGNSKWQN